MLTEKTYTVVCHGCGKIHQVKACFMSTPLSMELTNGRGMYWTLGCHGCPECMKDPSIIREAWEKGIKRETIAAANKNWAAWMEEGKFL